jgi:PAS domain S-box-containing protein
MAFSVQAASLPHGYCLLWQPSLIWLHATSDALIGAAYVTIPVTLAHFLRQRRDLPFNWMVWCFVTFILACGATHWLSVLNIWVPSWWLSGGVKALTAMASVPTAVLLGRLVPQMVAIPSPSQLQTMNDALAVEVAMRRRVEEELRLAHAELERRVEARTAELAAANDSLRLFESAVQQANDAITITTPELDPPGPRIVFANAAFSRITGYPLDDVLGRSPRLLQGPKTDRATLDRLRQTIARGEVFVGETVNYRKDGREFLMRWQVAPIRRADGAVSHLLAVQRDVTDERSLEAQLQQAQKMEAVGQLAGGIAHDFNNLLTAIQGNCSLLQTSVGSDDPRREFVDEICEAGERAERLTRQLLAFSRRQVRQPSALDLNAVVANALRLVGRLIGAGVTVRFNPAAVLGAVWADPGQLEQVVVNLALNARDAMPGGGTLTIETADVRLGADYAGFHDSVIPGEYVMLAVQDEGVGMDEATCARIFEPFFTTKELGKGTGLGLAMVYGIVKQSRGNIWVYSEPGVGTVFRLYFPRLATGIAEPAAVTPPSPEQVVAGRGRVLVVEDDRAVRQLAVRILEQAGYRTVAAADGAEAVRLVASSPEPFDLLLTDLVMPGMNGRELALRLRQDRPDLPVVFMSGYAPGAIGADELAAISPVIVPKPFSPLSLTQAIAGQLGRPDGGRG